LEGAAADRKAVSHALSALGFVDVDSTRPDLIVRVSAMRGALSGALFASDGKTRVPVDVPATAQAASPQALVAQLAPTIENLYVLRGLASLQNPNTAFRVSLQTDKTVYRLGDRLRVRLKADEDCYVALMHVDVNGVPRILLPNRDFPEIRLQKGREYVIPSPESGVVGSITVKPPTGRETLIAVATLMPVDWDGRGPNHKSSGGAGAGQQGTQRSGKPGAGPAARRVVNGVGQLRDRRACGPPVGALTYIG
jgi:hypothetical protein